MDPNELGVVVAVGPQGVGDGTLDFAAAEALRRETGVELLHVVHSQVVVPSRLGEVQPLDSALLGVGQTVLTAAAKRLKSRLHDKVPMTTELVTGPVGVTLTDRGAARDLVVLERREAGHLPTMSVSTRVAAHAGAPVVVVPHGWAPAAPDLPVTVGVDSPTDALGQVETVAAYVAGAGRPLTVLHATWLAEPYQDTFFVNHTRREWTHEADSELRVALEKLDSPGVEVSHAVRWARPADALVDASRRSALLVVSRRTVRGIRSVHLGPVTRAVLHHAECQ